MGYRSMYVIDGDKGELLVENANGDKLVVGIISGNKHLRVIVSFDDFLEVIANIVSEEETLLMKRRYISWDDYVMVPDMELIAALLLALREPLARAPRAAKRDDGEWAWSPEEEEAARKAAILLDIAATILRHPVAAEKLPSDVAMLIEKYEEGTLFKYIGEKKEKESEEGSGGS